MVYSYIKVVDYELAKEIIRNIRNYLRIIKNNVPQEIKNKIDKKYDELLKLENFLNINTTKENKLILKKYSLTLKKVINGEENPIIFLTI